MKEEIDGEVFISSRSPHVSFIVDMIKVLFHICTLNWRVNIYVSRQGNGINRRNGNTMLIRRIIAFSVLY